MESNRLRVGMTAPPTVVERDKQPRKMSTTSTQCMVAIPWLADSTQGHSARSVRRIIMKHESDTDLTQLTRHTFYFILFHLYLGMVGGILAGGQGFLVHSDCRPSRCRPGSKDTSNVPLVSSDSRHSDHLACAWRQIASLLATLWSVNGFFPLPLSAFFFSFPFFLFHSSLAGDWSVAR